MLRTSLLRHEGLWGRFKVWSWVGWASVRNWVWDLEGSSWYGLCKWCQIVRLVTWQLPLKCDSSGDHNPIIIKPDAVLDADSLFIWPVDSVPITNLIKSYPATNTRTTIKFTTRGVMDLYFGAKLTKVCNIRFHASKHFKWGFVFECAWNEVKQVIMEIMEIMIVHVNWALR
jgi:hypothetical protein